MASLRHKKSVIGHSNLPFNCPHTEEDYQRITNQLVLPANARILDLGCGRGELLCRIVESLDNAHGIGVDNSTEIVKSMRLPSKGIVDVHEMDMVEWLSSNQGDAFDLIICIGSLREGNQSSMIEDLSSRLNRGGYLLIGELVWVKEPNETFLEFLGSSPSNYLNGTGLISCISKCDTVIIDQTQTNLSRYETCILTNVEQWASEHVDDPDREKILEMSRSWHEFSSQHAWQTWEFATILAQKSNTALEVNEGLDPKDSTP
jgi:cyclopropane fatty-acyl-phospholipid synthase-like methyltransferase